MSEINPLEATIFDDRETQFRDMWEETSIKYENLRSKVAIYLTYKSLDGKVIRQELRKELEELVK